MWLKAPNILSLHGFSTRHGGVSSAPYDSLNLGGSEDAPANIAANRKLALQALGLNKAALASLRQVHGTEVCDAKDCQQTGDALVTKEKNMALVISIADCYPLLFEDPVNKVIGAAHAGWRGTVGKIAEHTIQRMEQLGASREHLRVAIGQGISAPNFEVGEEVLHIFHQAGFPSTCFNGNTIDLIACNKYVLLHSGIHHEHIWAMQRCTFESDFFSYRRDKGQTGRMWAVITQS